MREVRITEVLGYLQQPEIVDWMLRVGKAESNKIKRKATKIGTRVDDLIRTRELPTKKDAVEVHNCYGAYLKWLAVYQPKSIVSATTLKVADPTYGVIVVGTPDLYVDNVIVDLKCSKRVSKTYRIQVAMYRYLAKNSNIYTAGGAVLRLDKETSSYEYQLFEDDDDPYVRMWFGLLGVYLYLKEGDDDGNVV